MKDIWYLAHPVSGAIEDNVANALNWIKWLSLNVPERIYIAPWIAEVQAHQSEGEDIDPAFYDRVLADDCTIVRRCDGILLVGGKVSRGMGLELMAARDSNGFVQDQSHWREPPREGPPTRLLREILLSS